MQKLIKKSLKNGLRYYILPLNGTSTVTLMTIFQVGSRNETNAKAGISHFLEHMMFKGTKKRKNVQTLTRELDSLGAHYNAFTEKDATGYFIKSAQEHLPTNFEILSDMLLNSVFPAKEANKERKVILEEMKMYKDNPLFYIDDIFESRVFGKTNLGREIIGFKKSILKISTQDLKNYWATYYHPENFVIVLAGAVKPKLAEQLIKKYFAKLRPRARLPFVRYKFRQTRPQVSLVEKNTEQSQMAIGFPAFAYTNPRLPVLEVINTVMGASMSSRLFEVIREKLGLAYHIRTSITCYEDNGTFYARAGINPQKMTQALVKILQEFSRIKKSLISIEELKRAKQHLVGSLAIELEESDSYARWIAGQALFKPKIDTLEEIYKKINSVTREQIRQVASEIMLPQKLNLSIIGPHKNDTYFNQVLRKFK